MLRKSAKVLIGHRVVGQQMHMRILVPDVLCHPEVHAGTFREIEDVTFAVFSKQWLADYATVSVKASTLATYTSRINGPFNLAFGALKLSQIGTVNVQHYLAGMQRKKLSPATLRAHLVLLRGMLDHAVAWGYLAHNPATNVKSPKLPHTEMDSLTPEEVKSLLAACDDRHRALFSTGVMTGMRLGELLALQWDDVNWGGGTIRVQRSLYKGEFVEPKTSRSIRVIGMSNRLAAILLEHKLAAPYSPYDLVFPAPEGGPMDPANLRHRVWSDTLTRAKLRRIRIHDLRHTFASLLINQGESLKYVQSARTLVDNDHGRPLRAPDARCPPGRERPTGRDALWRESANS